MNDWDTVTEHRSCLGSGRKPSSITSERRSPCPECGRMYRVRVDGVMPIHSWHPNADK